LKDVDAEPYLSYLGIDMKLDVDQADYEDIPF
jgi:hypothetical protein